MCEIIRQVVLLMYIYIYIHLCFRLDIKLCLNIIGTFFVLLTHMNIKSYKTGINIMNGYGWLNGAHTRVTWMAERWVQLAGWGSHTYIIERRACALPFVIHVFVSQFTSHTPCLSHPCYVWRPFNQSYPSSGWMTTTHTHTMGGRENGTAG